MHVAFAQTAGRGRLGRTWESAGGEGLYLSLILLPGPPPLSPVALTMLTGLAVLGAVRRLGVTTARLDWPNDVVVGDAKLAGILVESRGLEPDAPHYVIGVGLNVGQRSFGPELSAERAVTSLSLEGRPVELERAREVVLEELAARLDAIREVGEELGAEFLAETGLKGSRVRVLVGSDSHEGRLEELSAARGLCLVDGTGRSRQHALEHVRAVRRVAEP